jgi:hypothetical protein
MAETLASYEYWGCWRASCGCWGWLTNLYTHETYIYMTSYSVGLDWANTQEGRSMFWKLHPDYVSSNIAFVTAFVLIWGRCVVRSYLCLGIGHLQISRTFWSLESIPRDEPPPQGGGGRTQVSLVSRFRRLRVVGRSTWRTSWGRTYSRLKTCRHWIRMSSFTGILRPVYDA